MSDQSTADVDGKILADRACERQSLSHLEAEQVADRHRTAIELGLENDWNVGVSFYIRANVGHLLTLDVDGVLAQFVERGDHARVRLVSALINDQVGEFLRDIDGRGFERAGEDLTAAARVGSSDGRLGRGGCRLKVVIAGARK